MAADRPVHLVRSADPEELLDAVERWHASGLYCIPAVWQRILECGDRHDTSSLVEVLTGTSLVGLDLIDALKARFPGSWTSVAYGSTEMGRGLVLLDADLHSRTRERGATTADGHCARRRRRRALAARPHHVLGLPRPPRRHRRGHRPRRLVPHRRPRQPATPTATSPSPDGRRSRSARAASGWRRSRSRPRSARTPRSPRSRSSGSPIPSGARSCARRSSWQPGATLPTVDELRAHVAGALVGPKQPRLVVQVDTLPRTDATGQVRRRTLRDALVAGRTVGSAG